MDFIFTKKGANLNTFFSKYQKKDRVFKKINAADIVCDEKGNRYDNGEVARKTGLTEIEFGATMCPEYKMHYTWDMNEDGKNDCYEDNSCAKIDQMSPRYAIPGVESGIVFDKRSNKWVDSKGICHSCTVENGYNPDGTMSKK